MKHFKTFCKTHFGQNYIFWAQKAALAQVGTAVKQLLKQLITAIKQFFKLQNLNFGHRSVLCARFQCDKLSSSWNSCQAAVKTANNSCQIAVKKFNTLKSL